MEGKCITESSKNGDGLCKKWKSSLLKIDNPIRNAVIFGTESSHLEGNC